MSNNNSFPGAAARPPSEPGGGGEGSPPLRFTWDPDKFWELIRLYRDESFYKMLNVADITAAYEGAFVERKVRSSVGG